jgi:ABC-type transport system, involved in lipoprotein release, permease component
MSGRGLPFELFLSLRYLRARGQRANLSLFVWIGVGGVFLGVSALIVVLAVMTGFQDGIKERIIAANPHILLLDSGGRGVTGAGEIACACAASPACARPRPSSSSRRCSPGRAGARRAGSFAG